MYRIEEGLDEILDVGMGIAAGAGALLIGGKRTSRMLRRTRICITVGVGGLLFVGGKNDVANSKKTFAKLILSAHTHILISSCICTLS